MTRHVYTYCNSCEETFWYIGHNDTNQEDDSFQPVVLQNKGNDEKGDPKKYSNTSNDVDEMFNLNSNWSFVRAKTTSQVSNTSHDSVVSGLYSDTNTVSFQSICREESQISGL